MDIFNSGRSKEYLRCTCGSLNLDVLMMGKKYHKTKVDTLFTDLLGKLRGL